MSERPFVTRAVVFPLDISASEERLLLSYCGARRFAYNWVIGLVTENLDVRRRERAAGISEDRLTPPVSWSAYSLTVRWNSVKEEVAPWWRDVSMHAFRSGIVDAAEALKNWSDGQAGRRRGRKIGFLKFKKRGRSTPSVSFVETNHQLSWFHADRHHVRLMLPRYTSDLAVHRRRRQLEWLHTTESTSRLYAFVESGKATIQKVTISKRGGRWQASFQVRFRMTPMPRPTKHHGAMIAIDVGLKHLVTTSEPVPGVTDGNGHVANPRVLEGQLSRLRRLDQAMARSKKTSKNHKKLVARRARLHGRIAKTRALYLHPLTTALASGFEVIAVEDLHLAGMANRKRHIGRKLTDASLGELLRQLAYKTTDRGHHLVTISRFFPSSKTCSECGFAKAKLPLAERTFRCDQCGYLADRDVNAARSIAQEASRLLQQTVAATPIAATEQTSTSPGYDRETLNADRRLRKTSKASAELAAVVVRQNQAVPPTVEPVGSSDLDGSLATAAGSTGGRADDGGWPCSRT